MRQCSSTCLWRGSALALHVHVNDRCRGKEERSIQTTRLNNKAKQHTMYMFTYMYIPFVGGNVQCTCTFFLSSLSSLI